MRREIGIRTVFKILGPLTNPGNARGQVLGVYDRDLVERLANALCKLCVERAIVVHGLDGLDEISNLGKTQISELKGGEVKTYFLEPKDFGFDRSRPEEIRGYDRDTNARLMLKLLRGGDGPRRDVVLMNSAAAMVVGGKASDFEEGVELSRVSIDKGDAYKKLRDLIKATGGDMSKFEVLEAKL